MGLRSVLGGFGMGLGWVGEGLRIKKTKHDSFAWRRVGRSKCLKATHARTLLQTDHDPPVYGQGHPSPCQTA